MMNNTSKIYTFRMSPIEQAIFFKHLEKYGYMDVRNYVNSTVIAPVFVMAYNKMQALKHG